MNRSFTVGIAKLTACKAGASRSSIHFDTCLLTPRTRRGLRGMKPVIQCRFIPYKAGFLGTSRLNFTIEIVDNAEQINL